MFAFTGDGCFRLIAGCLAEARSLGIVLFVLDNGSFAIVAQGLPIILPGHSLSRYHSELARIDFGAMARACDWSSWKLAPDLANRAAQRRFEYGWEEITSLRARFWAEEPNQEERSRLIGLVRTQGFIADYRGVRIAKSGRRFWIENGTVWNLIDRAGMFHGQAATFSDWKDV